MLLSVVSTLEQCFASMNILLLPDDAVEGGFGRGESRGDSHTFDLIKLFTYPHMPPGSFAGHMKDGPGQRRETEREHSSDLAFGERKFNDMQGGEAQVTSRD